MCIVPATTLAIEQSTLIGQYTKRPALAKSCYMHPVRNNERLIQRLNAPPFRIDGLLTAPKTIRKTCLTIYAMVVLIFVCVFRRDVTYTFLSIFFKVWKAHLQVSRVVSTVCRHIHNRINSKNIWPGKKDTGTILNISN